MQKKPALSHYGRAWLLAVALSTTISGAAQAQVAQAPVATDSRVKTFVYNENDVYNLLTYYGFQSNVEFGPKELIETVSIGDRAGWQVVPAGRRLFVRAVANELHTNMTVVTNLRAYQFDLRATDPSTVPQEELVYVIRFFYPEDAARKAPGSPIVPAAPVPLSYPTPAPQPTAYSPPAPVAANALTPLAPLAPAPGLSAPTAAAPAAITSYPLHAPSPAPVTGSGTLPRAASTGTLNAPTANRYGAGPFDTPVANNAAITSVPLAASLAPSAPAPASAGNAALNFNYTYTGEGTIIPQTMFDDGKKTYFQYSDPKKIPKIYKLNKGGKDTPLTYKREGEYVVIPLTTAQFGLMQNGKMAVIYNEAQK